jgi:hypothetical protein
MKMIIASAMSKHSILRYFAALCEIFAAINKS